MDHVPVEDTTLESISIARCRELLGDDADGLSEHDVDLIRRHADAMAQIIVAIFLEKNARQE